MKTIFETQNINEFFYDRFIGKYIMFQIPWSNRLKFWTAKKSLQIIIRSSDRASEDPFFSIKFQCVTCFRSNKCPITLRISSVNT